MSASEILNKLISEEIKLSQALQFSRLLLMDSNSSTQIEWIMNECNGYDNKLSVPEYRKFPCGLYARSAIAFYGEHSKPLDARELDADIVRSSGASLYTMYVSDNIENIEKLIENLKGDTITMLMPEDMNKLFIESINVPGGKVLNVYQQAPASYLYGIISSVKNELINILIPIAQKETNNEVGVSKNVSASTTNYKSVFISYSYDNHKHEQWVKHFVDVLKASGVKTAFDKDLPYGADIPSFMVNGIQNADVVLVIGTPDYLSKVKQSETTGAKFEDVIITNSLMNDIETTKFIPILRAGTFKTSFAPLLEHRRGIDFSQDSEFDEKMLSLLNDVLKK